jgi:acetyl-CoA acetyltransferase
MEKYGATSEHLAHVAITQRKHAQNNPNAAMRGKPMTMDDCTAPGSLDTA